MMLIRQARIALFAAAIAAMLIAAPHVSTAATGGTGNTMSAVESAPLTKEEKQVLMKQVQAAHFQGS